MNEDAKEDYLAKAKEKIPVDITDEKYGFFLFVTLRQAGCNLKDAITIMSREYRNNTSLNIKYSFLYEVEQIRINHLLPVADVEGYKEQYKKRHKSSGIEMEGYMSNIILLDALMHGPRNVTELDTLLKRARQSLIK